MSYINEALKKAQKEKDSRLTGYRPVIKPFPSAKTPLSRVKLAVGLFTAILLLVLVAAIVWFFVPGKPLGTSDHQQVAIAPSPAIADKNKTDDMAKPVEVVPSHQTVSGPAVSEPTGSKSKEKERTPAPSEIRQMPVTAAIPVRKLSVGEIKTLYREALNAQRRHDAANAERLYGRILESDPRHAEALNNLGVIYMQKKKGDQAIRLFDRAIALKVNYVDPYYNMACLYAQHKDVDGSLKYLRKAVAINPDVRQWARNDVDLQGISTSPAFKSLIGDGNTQ
ncbi:MAG: hypothetical protein CSYNP_02536 [Syntrophus sp. SKADARSKE-3]|nr:hypothetical protein [Syntrophus sp. SKADARSKE-3]